jgi:hypothetical protein
LFVFGGWWLGGYWEGLRKSKRSLWRPLRRGFAEASWFLGGREAGIEDHGAGIRGKRGGRKE